MMNMSIRIDSITKALNQHGLQFIQSIQVAHPTPRPTSQSPMYSTKTVPCGQQFILGSDIQMFRAL